MSPKSRVFVVAVVLLALVAGTVWWWQSSSVAVRPLAAQESEWLDLGGGIEIKVRAILPTVPSLTATPTPTSTPSAPTPTLAPAGGTIVVPDSMGTVDGGDIQPGDVVLIPSSRTTLLRLKGLRGTEARPITITNYGGQVIIADGEWVGIDVVDCQYVRLTGTGSGDKYGFVLRDPTNCGVFVRSGSSHVEIDHVEVGPTGGAGIRAHSFLFEVPEGWVQRDIAVHDCYVHGTHTEGMYLGNYGDVHPASDGLEVYRNVLRNVGLEGIQIKNFANVDVHHNDLVDIGMRFSSGQGRSGIDLQHDHDSEGKIHDNYIENARRGIELNGAGPTAIFSNTIVGCGYREDGGGGIRWFSGSGMDIHGNLIADCNEYGVKVSDQRTGLIRDNVICGTRGDHIINTSVTESGNVERENCEVQD